MDDQRFLESEWDYCLVLDACRYDVFEDVYDEYLDGNLEKRRSVGSSTPEWAYRSSPATTTSPTSRGTPLSTIWGSR